jgi:ATP-dependent DNA helicase RecG
MSVYNTSFTKEDIRWRNKAISKFKKENKRNRTVAESRLRDYLRVRFRGISKIREQKAFFTPTSFVLVDFYLSSFNVGIEVDGGYHNTSEQMEKDLKRQSILDKRRKFGRVMGVPIIRVTNEEVMGDIGLVLDKIYKFAVKNKT